MQVADTRTTNNERKHGHQRNTNDGVSQAHQRRQLELKRRQYRLEHRQRTHRGHSDVPGVAGKGRKRGAGEEGMTTAVCPLVLVRPEIGRRPRAKTAACAGVLQAHISSYRATMAAAIYHVDNAPHVVDTAIRAFYPKVVLSILLLLTGSTTPPEVARDFHLLAHSGIAPDHTHEQLGMSR